MAGMVIIGCGQAGGQAAASLRQEKYEGPITMIGQEPISPTRDLLSRNSICQVNRRKKSSVSDRNLFIRKKKLI